MPRPTTKPLLQLDCPFNDAVTTRSQPPQPPAHAMPSYDHVVPYHALPYLYHTHLSAVCSVCNYA